LRLSAILAFVGLLGITASAATGKPVVTVAVHLQGESTPTKAADATLRKLAVDLLESSNFNTATHPGVLKQSIPAIQDRYRRVVAGDCLVITYASPVKIGTVGGKLSVSEIVIGLGRPDYADALFTIDEDGRVVAHEKYSGAIAVELRKAADAGVGAR